MEHGAGGHYVTPGVAVADNEKHSHVPLQGTDVNTYYNACS